MKAEGMFGHFHWFIWSIRYRHVSYLFIFKKYIIRCSFFDIFILETITFVIKSNINHLYYKPQQQENKNVELKKNMRYLKKEKKSKNKSKTHDFSKRKKRNSFHFYDFWKATSVHISWSLRVYSVISIHLF